MIVAAMTMTAACGAKIGRGMPTATAFGIPTSEDVFNKGESDFAKDANGIWNKYNEKFVRHIPIKELTKLGKYQKQCLYDNHPLDKKVQQRELEALLQ